MIVDLGTAHPGPGTPGNDGTAPSGRVPVAGCGCISDPPDIPEGPLCADDTAVGAQPPATPELCYAFQAPQ
ncbi:hypothetical protein GCM10010430_34180 [Kitasatospora cystarginea]|uniref:Uncharacterized protein n=1 Tax=Kitasatospora cystarginea TaxID=58350 RepID=A0ABP5R4N6_9ACTN